MRYANLDLLIEMVERLETIDKKTMIQLIKKCETFPYEQLLLKLYKERK